MLGQQGAALATIPEDESLRGQDDAASSERQVAKKKKKKRKLKRRSKLSQPGGMTDQEKSMWLLEHCKVCTCSKLKRSTISLSTFLGVV